MISGGSVLIDEYMGSHPSLADWLKSVVPEGFGAFALPDRYRFLIRTSTPKERAVKYEIKRRTRIFGVFPKRAVSDVIRLGHAGADRRKLVLGEPPAVKMTDLTNSLDLPRSGHIVSTNRQHISDGVLYHEDYIATYDV